MGTPESRSALFEQAIANLIEIASVEKLATRPRDPFDFYLRTQDDRRVAVEVKAFPPPLPQVRRIAQKALWTERALVDEYWLVTPNSPGESARNKLLVEMERLGRPVRWFDQQQFQIAIGLEPRKLISDQDFARLQAAAAGARIAPRNGQHDAAGDLIGGTDWGRYGRLLLGERVGADGPQAIGDTESVAAYLRLGEQGRDVTTLNSDLANYSALVRVRPREVVDVMSRYYRRARQIVLARGGFFYQFTGDGVVALFGYPRTDSQAAVRSVRAAADLIALGRDTLEELNERMNEAIPVGTRVGIATDELSALSSSDRLFEPAFIGNSINLAARLQAAAVSDGVVIDNKTRGGLGMDPSSRRLPVQPLLIPLDRARGQLSDINAWKVEADDLVALVSGDST